MKKGKNVKFGSGTSPPFAKGSFGDPKGVTGS